METKSLTPKEIINEISHYFNINLTELAEKTGIPRNSFYHACYTKELSQKNCGKIYHWALCKMGVKINPNWLRYGIGEMIDKNTKVDPQKDEKKQTEKPDYREKYEQLLEENTKLLEERIKLKEKIADLIDFLRTIQ